MAVANRCACLRDQTPASCLGKKELPNSPLELHRKGQLGGLEHHREELMESVKETI